MGIDSSITNTEYVYIYKLSTDDLREMGINDVDSDDTDGWYIVIYNIPDVSVKVYNTIGFEISDGNTKYGLDDIRDIEISRNGLNVYINAIINDDNMSNLFHEKTLTSGCCVGVSANFEGKIIEKFLSQKIEFSIEQIKQSLYEFQKNTDLFSLTGCVHKAMLFCDDKIFTSEDIGRHNALDKALGKAKMARANTKEALLIVSGRLSMEMVIKCAMHDIPVVVSNAATTALGIKSAQNLGITLIGFARNGNLNIYTHSNRIKLNQKCN